MSQPSILVKRSKRINIRKRRSFTYTLLIENGFIVASAFLLTPISELAGVVAMLLSISILPFISTNRAVMLFSNVMLLFLPIMFLNGLDLNSMKHDLSIFIVVLIVLLFFILFLIQAFFITFKIYKEETEEPPNTDESNFILYTLVKLFYFSNLIITKISLILPLIYYIVITIFILYMYSIFYSTLNDYYDVNGSNAGFFIESVAMTNDDAFENLIYKDSENLIEVAGLKRIPTVSLNYDAISYNQLVQNTTRLFFSEYMYFSSTTFFTVGYGDIEIRGMVPKLLVQSEMFIAGFTNIIFVPLFLFVITDNILKMRKRKEFGII